MHACGGGSVAALKQLLPYATSDELKGALHAGAISAGGSAELVELVLEARADINEHWVSPARSFRLLLLLQSGQYRLGRRTPTTTLGHHFEGSTPLMLAVITGQYEVAAALIAAGARLNPRNQRFASLANQLPLPGFLCKALNGNDDECREVAALAMLHHESF
mmetsp:Transcript_6499/g.14957  ORF Transcript_6499/g.14957 Transcript_6499/m.14957 type:complete len:163 (-) Transcript_6499:327-815(-)